MCSVLFSPDPGKKELIDNHHHYHHHIRRSHPSWTNQYENRARPPSCVSSGHQFEELLHRIAAADVVDCASKSNSSSNNNSNADDDNAGCRGEGGRGTLELAGLVST